MAEHFISRDDASSDLFTAAAYLAEGIRSADGYAEAMNVVIPAYLAKGEVDLAAELANTVEDPFSRDRLLIKVAQKCAEIDDVDYALQLADAIEDHGMQSEAQERVANVRAGKGDTATALEIAQSMLHPDYVYAEVAVHAARSGNEAGADAALEKIEFPSAAVGALHHIAAAKIADDKADAAVRTLERAADLADEIEHDEEKIRTMCDIASLFARAQRNDKAITIYDHAQKLASDVGNMHRDSLLVRCALGFLYAGSEELCDRALDLVTDKTQMASALLAIARHERERGSDQAADTLDEAYQIIRSQRDIETRDSKARNNIMASIAMEFAVFGQTERAIEAALENQDPQQGTAALSQIAYVLAVAGDDEQVRQTINAIPEDADRMFALIAIADLHEKSGNLERAAETLNEAASLSDAVPQLSARASALSSIADRFGLSGDKERARQLGLESLHVISEIKDESSQAVALGELGHVYERRELQLGDNDSQILEAMLQRADRP